MIDNRAFLPALYVLYFPGPVDVSPFVTAPLRHVDQSVSFVVHPSGLRTELFPLKSTASVADRTSSTPSPFNLASSGVCDGAIPVLIRYLALRSPHTRLCIMHFCDKLLGWIPSSALRSDNHSGSFPDVLRQRSLHVHFGTQPQ